MSWTVLEPTAWQATQEKPAVCGNEFFAGWNEIWIWSWGRGAVCGKAVEVRETNCDVRGVGGKGGHARFEPGAGLF